MSMRPALALAAAAAVAVPSLMFVPRASAADVDTSSTDAFIRTIAPLAQEDQRVHGVPASVTIAQAIVESGWGKSALSVSAKNYFGIKCVPGGDNGPYAQKDCFFIDTKEYVNGKWITVKAPFRQYTDVGRSVLDHGDFLRSRSRYANAFKYTNDPDQFIREVAKAGYATAPDYADAMIARMKQYDLYKYNAAPAPVSVVVDNATPGRFTASSAWGMSAYDAQRHGTDYRFAEPKAVSDVAWFRANVAKAGRYRVEVWHPDGTGYSSSAPHLVVTSSGSKTVYVNQTSGGGRWRSLGDFDLAAGDRNVVGVSRWTAAPGLVVADAVRLTPLP